MYLATLAQRLDRVAIYQEFLWLTQNGTQLQSLTLDRESVLGDGKVPWSLGKEVRPFRGLWMPGAERALNFLRLAGSSTVSQSFPTIEREKRTPV